MEEAHYQPVDLQEVAAGNEKAFKDLFDKYRGRLFHYISRFVKSDQVAEELVLDVFMKIWTGRELIAQVQHFDAFLFRIAHNKSIDFLRSAARDPRLQELLCEAIELAGADTADAALITHEYEEKVRKAISLLSPQCKKVYTLSREQDLSHDEIARQLQISPATVNNHIVLAQRFIRNYLVKEIDLAIVILLIGKF
ncbi:RNA polymerase sigma-70 factor [Chitinophaga sp. Ak27]|uniref:RNA polymerase sigma-70 factor n=1 Tax=Chitinophaga sp. Ak27 TaxID=2726116 RepID=UPI00145E817C|nr:RNA polymerase sigma-70 factor [Chitinophaga sp. Ak27]NLU90490.1 RNA polymerase sigma-70 factor [Chitinophaga sp. Ak27]